MRSTFALAGFVALVAAGTTTITDTVDVTITSCEPTVSNCPYKADPTSWAEWDVSASTTTTTSSVPVQVTSTSSSSYGSWSDWASSTSSSTSSVPVSASSTTSWTTYATSAWVSSSSSVAAASTSSAAWAPYSGSPVSPAVATFTGAASNNVASFGLAGLAVAAVMVIA